jgi:EmrB/QacA subfamily drug resistance transporter
MDGEPHLRVSSAAGRWVLLATVLGSSMAMLDSTVVNVALPTIGRSLGASLAGLQWTVTGYTLSLAGLILLGGSLGDRAGRRRVFLIGVVWFALASALCAAAPDIAVLIGARVLQGIGGALLTPGSLAIIQATFAADDRPRAVGAWSGFGGVAAAVGPLVGGWLVQAGWRWVFLLNLPLAAAVVVVTRRHVPETKDPAASGKFDVSGAVLAALGLAGITYALIEATEPSGKIGVIAAAVAGVSAAVGFVVVERRRTRSPRPVPPMLPLDVFASRQFSFINVITFLVYGAFGGLLFLLVLQLQVVSGFSPVAAGASLLPVTLLMLGLSARSGSLAQRVGPRWPMTIGITGTAVGMLLMSRIGVNASYFADVFPAVTVFGLGLSLTVAPLTATVLASADVRHAGVASGVNNAVARAASLVAVAALPAAVGLTSASYHEPARFSDGFHAATLACAVVLLIAAVLAALLVNNDVLRPGGQAMSAPEAATFCSVGAPQLQPVPPRGAAPLRVVVRFARGGLGRAVAGIGVLAGVGAVGFGMVRRGGFLAGFRLRRDLGGRDLGSRDPDLWPQPAGLRVALVGAHIRRGERGRRKRPGP